MASTGPDAVLDSPEILEPPPAEIPTVEIAAAGAHEAPTPAHARLGAEAVIRLRGEDLLKLPLHKVAQAGIGYVPEERGIFASLTVSAKVMSGELFARTAATVTGDATSVC